MPHCHNLQGFDSHLHMFYDTKHTIKKNRLVMSHCDVDHLHSNNNEHMLTWYINNMVWNIIARLHYEFVMIYVIMLVYNMGIKYILLN